MPVNAKLTKETQRVFHPCDAYSLVEQTDITKSSAHVISSNYKCEQELLPGERGA